MQKKSLETILYSTLGVVVMLAVLILVNFILGFARTRKDMTQEQAYTLSAGTKAILKKLDTPSPSGFTARKASRRRLRPYS